MKYYDISVRGGPFMTRVEAADFEAAAQVLGLDYALFEETSPGAYESGTFVVQEIDTDPFHVASKDLEALAAFLEVADISDNPALTRVLARVRAILPG